MMNVEKIVRLLKEMDEINPTDVAYALEDFDNIKVKNGYTKVVIVSNDDDFVIKIPRDDTVCYNYCERESHVYERACKWGIEFLFAKMERVGTLDKSKHRYYYKQTKVESLGYYDTNQNQSFNILEIPVIDRMVEKVMVKNERNRFNRSCSKLWYAHVLKHYGVKTLEKLLIFIKDAKINDLRDENVGFKNGLPIILDYSGFHGGNRN